MFQSLRIGFATNSSSTHSVILHSKYKDISTIDDDNFSVDFDGYADQNYILASKEAKLGFLAIANFEMPRNLSAHQMMDFHHLVGKVAQKHHLDLQKVMEKVKGIKFSDVPDLGKCPKGVDLETWFDFFLSEPLVAYGYYDNNTAPYEEGDVDVNGISLSSWNTTWRQDGKALVGFDASTGNKIRWSPDSYTKAGMPELVDVKITDYCGYGCKFCYQGSTKRGKHARLEDLEMIFDQLQSMNCFEIAVGGGEPAHHPEFARIIEMAKARNLTFNFTAYGTDWSKDEAVLNAMRQTEWGGTGFGVGISVHKAADIKKIATAKANLREAKLHASVIAQTVIGATPMGVTMDLMEACAENRMPLILLGFKRTGRGKNFKVSKAEREDVKTILKAAQKHINDERFIADQPFHLSVDTAFLDLYGDVLDEMKVPHILRTSPEGAFSMYVDAVEMTCGPSSYCEKDMMVPIGDLKSQFAGF